MDTTLILDLQIEPAQAGSYFTLPFQVPEGITSLGLSYTYARRLDAHHDLDHGVFTARPEVNIIDLGLIAPDGSQVGASGSDKTEIRLSETGATPGYRPCRIVPGEWKILVGAYKVAPEGVRVNYEVALEEGQRRLLRGDLHTHTIASDGVHTAEELAFKAKRNGLDFVAITDHNQPVARASLPRIDGVTLIPGLEWTHYQGHANFLGSEHPYDGAFATHTLEEARGRFESARQRGAVITVNHPFDEGCPFTFDLNAVPFDCLEIWNGPMREANLRAVGLWQHLLCAGRRVPACGGSDYHRDTPFIFLGGPTMGVYADSRGATDILAAVRAGRSFITFAPNGPALELTAGEAVVGESVSWAETQAVTVKATGLLTGDVVRVVTNLRSDVVFQAPSDGDVSLAYALEAPGFARVEVLRAFLPGLPMLPALLSNPIYFEA